jgi:hypothetical protein
MLKSVSFSWTALGALPLLIISILALSHPELMAQQKTPPEQCLAKSRAQVMRGVQAGDPQSEYCADDARRAQYCESGKCASSKSEWESKYGPH